jgi:hypothetical protein
VRNHGRGTDAERIAAGLIGADGSNVYPALGVYEHFAFVVSDGITEIYGNKAKKVVGRIAGSSAIRLRGIMTLQVLIQLCIVFAICSQSFWYS